MKADNSTPAKLDPVAERAVEALKDCKDWHGPISPVGLTGALRARQQGGLAMAATSAHLLVSIVDAYRTRNGEGPWWSKYSPLYRLDRCEAAVYLACHVDYLTECLSWLVENGLVGRTLRCRHDGVGRVLARELYVWPLMDAVQELLKEGRALRLKVREARSVILQAREAQAVTPESGNKSSNESYRSRDRLEPAKRPVRDRLLTGKNPASDPIIPNASPNGKSTTTTTGSSSRLPSAARGLRPPDPPAYTYACRTQDGKQDQGSNQSQDERQHENKDANQKEPEHSNQNGNNQQGSNQKDGNQQGSNQSQDENEQVEGKVKRMVDFYQRAYPCRFRGQPKVTAKDKDSARQFFRDNPSQMGLSRVGMLMVMAWDLIGEVSETGYRYGVCQRSDNLSFFFEHFEAILGDTGGHAYDRWSFRARVPWLTERLGSWVDDFFREDLKQVQEQVQAQAQKQAREKAEKENGPDAIRKLREAASDGDLTCFERLDGLASEGNPLAVEALAAAEAQLKARDEAQLKAKAEVEAQAEQGKRARTRSGKRPRPCTGPVDEEFDNNGTPADEEFENNGAQ